MSTSRHLSAEDLDSGLDEIRRSPREVGSLRMIVRRPHTDGRERLASGELNPEEGLAGDDWKNRQNPRSDDGRPHPDTQLTIMNSRAAQLISGDESRWPLAGDQLFVDLALGGDDLPPGSRLGIGEAIVEITATPHTGCAKFAARFGKDALRFVNTTEGRALKLRGIYAKVIRAGKVREGDSVRRIPDGG